MLFRSRVWIIITKENLQAVLTFFDSIGIIPKLKDGYYYPYSNQAVSIQNALIEEAKYLNVKIETNIYIEKINYLTNEKKYEIITTEKNYYTPNIIIATGSNASLKNDSIGNGYQLLKNLGHTIIKPLPALVQLNINQPFLKEWSGIRAEATIKLLEDNEEKRTENEIGRAHV